MRAKQFFRVFATLVEKATREPLIEDECDFEWRSYFDSDIPEPSQKHNAVLAAEEYLSENGWKYPDAVRAEVECVLGDLVSIPRGEF